MARSLPDLVLKPLAFIDGSPVNEALFSADSRDFVASLELSSEPLFNASFRHFGPVLQRWQADGQLHADLRETPIRRDLDLHQGVGGG